MKIISNLILVGHMGFLLVKFTLLDSMIGERNVERYKRKAERNYKVINGQTNIQLTNA